MAKETLPVNYQDDAINAEMGGRRRYNVINNDDGTISLEDVTAYDQTGSEFGAAQVNAITGAVNASADVAKIIDDPDAIAAVTASGYMAGALALKGIQENFQAGVDAVYDACVAAGATPTDKSLDAIVNTINGSLAIIEGTATQSYSVAENQNPKLTFYAADFGLSVIKGITSCTQSNVVDFYRNTFVIAADGSSVSTTIINRYGATQSGNVTMSAIGIPLNIPTDATHT